MNLTLPKDSTARKGFPIFSGCMAYFSAALAGVARWSKLGNDKHNPGEPLHHARGKSMDHRDCIPRHLMDLADLEAALARQTWKKGLRANEDSARLTDIIAALLDECDALAWRSLALSQDLHEKYDNAPLAPGARLPEPEPEARYLIAVSAMQSGAVWRMEPGKPPVKVSAEPRDWSKSSNGEVAKAMAEGDSGAAAEFRTRYPEPDYRLNSTTLKGFNRFVLMPVKRKPKAKRKTRRKAR